MELNNKNILIIGNVVSLAFALIVNILSNALPLNGKTAGELSDSYPNLFVPAGYVFAIWGIIYVLLIIFGVYQALPQNRNNEFIEKISYIFILSNLANATWLIFWHYEQVLVSLFLMLILLSSLVLIYVRLDIGRRKVNREEKLAVTTLFSVYLGWITVATIANVTAFLVSISWDRFGISEEIWTFIILTVATTIVVAVVLRHEDIIYGMVPVWAFIGISIKQITNSVFISLIAVIYVGIILFLIVFIGYKKSIKQIS